MSDPSKKPLTIFWFRRDLRLEDNAGLFYALSHSENVLPIFIFDVNILSQLPDDDARLTYIGDSLKHINDALKDIARSLAVFYGDPIEVFSELTSEHEISSVVTNTDYEPYAIARDREISEILKLKSIGFQTIKDHVIFEQDEVVKDDGTPYVVFTPYSRKWKQKLLDNRFTAFESQKLLHKITKHSYPFLTIEEIGFRRSAITVPNVELSNELIQNYDAVRNFPAMNLTTKLSTTLRFGTISIRKVVTLAQAQNETFLNELIWREFFMQILWHFPSTVRNSFRPKYDAIKWRNDETEFKNWCDGKTGYPIVDAGMRELNATGFMQNRVRMITASFLCKHLLIDWRWGETYFALKLLDYEQASNVGNWQWAAGSGVDAAPYFRIFNPSEQIRKFDKELKYIRKWVPELDGFDYPQPIVDHKEARERCLRVYKEAVG